MKLNFYVLATTALISLQQPVNAGLFNFMKSCDKECVQENVCKDAKTAEWCRKNCNLKADKNGRIFNGVCFEVLTQNAKKVTEESVDAIVTTCKKRVTEIQYYSEHISRTFPNKNSEVKALVNLIRQTVQSIDEMQRPFTNFRLSTMTEAHRTKFGNDLSAYELTCRRLTDSVTDFAYWAQNLVPVGGYKSLRPGTTRAEADKIFTATRDANER